jgi:hypothetical protein
MRSTALRVKPVIGEPLLHPVALVSVGILLLNDHCLKARFPGAVTGKLSDIAGLIFFPLLLWSLVDITSRLVRNRTGLTRWGLYACIAITALVFSAGKSTVIGAELCRWFWAAAQWPFRAIAAERIISLRKINFVQDPTDLYVLPTLLITAWIGHQSTRFSSRLS